MTFGMSLFGVIPLVLLAILVQSAVTQPAIAQSGGRTSNVSIQAGAITVQQPNRTALSAATISLSARRANNHSSLRAAGHVFRTSESSTAAQATLGAELALPRLPSLRLEFSGTATTFGALSSDRGSSREGYVRQHYVRARFGVFGTLGAGTVRRDRVGHHALAWDAGAWTRRGMFTGVLSLRRSFTNDSLLMEASDIFLSRAARHYAVQDLQGTVTAHRSRFEWVASAAWRNGVGATTGHGVALLAAVTTNLTSRFGLVITGGQQLAEPLSGVPAAKVLGASLRMFLLGGSSTRVPRQAARVSANASPLATRIDRHATGGAAVTVRVQAPSSASVEFAGSFNDWASLPMTRIGDTFELTVELPRGTHRVAVRVNGGEWKAPTGLARVKDELGGESGIVVVP